MTQADLLAISHQDQQQAIAMLTFICIDVLNAEISVKDPVIRIANVMSDDKVIGSVNGLLKLCADGVFDFKDIPEVRRRLRAVVSEYLHDEDPPKWRGPHIAHDSMVRNIVELIFDCRIPLAILLNKDPVNVTVQREQA